ncbi:MAG: hypothetical protein IJV05_07140 [Muribaculaceae bacterium]|nr:hypothetical protein [Muribaculaceae bacterium]
MKRTILIILAILTLIPAALRAQGSESLYNGWGLGFEVGLGGMAPTSSLGDNIKACALFTGGLNAEVNRFRFKADVAYGQPSFKNKNPYAIIDDQGRDAQLNATANPTLVGLTFQLGYTAWRRGKVSVTPMLGLSWNHLSWELNDIKYQKDDEGIERPVIDNVTATGKSSVGWMASVDIDIRLHGKLVDSPLGGDDQQGHYTSSVRISPFVTHARCSGFIPEARGVCIGATVTYAGFLRLIK